MHCQHYFCNSCDIEKFKLTEDTTNGENVAVDERPGIHTNGASDIQNMSPKAPAGGPFGPRAPDHSSLAALASEDLQEVDLMGFPDESCAAITDSGYASAVNPLLLGAQPGCGSENPSSSAQTAGDTGVDEDDAKTTYSVATRITYADVRHSISELSHEIAARLQADRSIDLKQLTGWANALPELIKVFGIMIGRESPSQMNRDIMYFVHRHHR